MATITARILQSHGLNANIGSAAAREVGLTDDTERPLVGTTVGGTKFIGTEDFLTITVQAPAAVPLLRRSIVRILCDTASAAGNINLDIRNGAQIAGYECHVIVTGSKNAIVTYATGQVEYVAPGEKRVFFWTGSLWVPMRNVQAPIVGTVIEMSGMLTPSATMPVIPMWDADHTFDATTYPLAYTYLRSQKAQAGAITDFTVTVSGGIVSFTGTEGQNMVKAIGEEWTLAGVNARYLNVNGTDYLITNVNTVGYTITCGAPGSGTQTAIFYPYRTGASQVTLFKDQGRATMSWDGVTYINGIRRRDRFQGHWHALYSGATPLFNSFSGTSVSPDGLRMASGNNTNLITSQAIKEAVTDTANGTPRTGPYTEPNSTILFRYFYAGVIL